MSTGWWRVRSRSGAGDGVWISTGRRSDGVSRSAQRVAAAWGAWAVAVYDQSGVCVDRRAVAGAAAGERDPLRDASGHVHDGGHLEAAIERLDYLCELGVTHVELMPVAAFAGELGMGLRRRRAVCGDGALRRPGCG